MITTEQRKHRRKFLGSSDSPVIMGLSPYAVTPTDVYWSKVADVQDEKTEAMSVGNWLETPLIEWAAGELGVKVTDKPKDLSYHREGDGWDIFACNLDARIVGKKEAIEAKFANGEMAQAYGEPGTDRVAYHVTVQCQHQMYVAGLDCVHVALAVPSYYGIERRLYHVPRDVELIDMIVDFGQKWWAKHVHTLTPPDGQSVPPLYILKTLERKTGVQIKLPDEAMQWADERTRLKEQIKALESEVESVDAKIIHALGDDAEIGLLGDGRKVTYQQYESSNLDSKRLRTERPDVAAEYMVKSLYRTLYVKKK